MPRDRTYTRRAALGAGVSTLSLSSGARAATHDGRTWVVIELAGGADALSLVVPYRDPWYHRARRATAIAPPGSRRGAAIALDDQWALHPALAPAYASFARGEMAVAVAIGPNAIERSHLAAQRALRNTLLAALAPHQPDESIETNECPRGQLVERARAAARDARAATGPALRILRSTGWDTHAAQGNGLEGRFALRAAELGAAIDAFRCELGKDLERAALLVVSEFGRSLHETPMRGTDDGHAGVCFLLGTEVGGGRVLGRWPGLAPDALSHRRFVAPTGTLSDLLASIDRRNALKEPIG